MPGPTLGSVTPANPDDLVQPLAEEIDICAAELGITAWEVILGGFGSARIADALMNYAHYKRGKGTLKALDFETREVFKSLGV